ncbi:hydrogenase maturation protein [Peptostreptococcaceae bacterium oral taxon 081]|nr:hydrogenase maturation protein [Peptostreptococcaceae bacterium oral taxon 081]
MSIIKNGKLTVNQLKKLIYSNLGKRRKEVITMPLVGQDCGYFYTEDNIISITTDPITATDTNIGKLSVIINLNDIATSFAEPFAITVTLLCPENTTEEKIYQIMKDISDECIKNDVQIVGGHTEVTTAVNQILVCVTALGKLDKKRYEETEPIKSGDNIYMSKEISLEGSMIIACEKKEELKEVLTDEEFEIAKLFLEKLSVVKESKLLKNKKISLMHDVTEGGILGALYEMCSYAQKGCMIDYDKIKINSITKKISKFYNIDPLRLISSGCMLIITNEEISEKIDDISFTKIGKITDDNKLLMKKDDGFIEIEEPDSDEIYKVI